MREFGREQRHGHRARRFAAEILLRLLLQHKQQMYQAWSRAMTHSGRDSELRVKRILDGRVQRFCAQFELACE